MKRNILGFGMNPVFNSDSGAMGGGGEAPTQAPVTESAPLENGGMPQSEGEKTEDLTGLKNSLSAARRDANEWEKRFKQLQQSFDGVDPNAAKQALDNYKRLQEQQEQWNRRETELTTKLQSEADQRVQRVSKEASEWKTRHDELLTRTLAQQAYEAAGGRAGGTDDATYFDVLYNSIRGQLRLNDKGQLEVVDGTGARIFSKKNTSDPMGAGEFFGLYNTHPVYSYLFNPQGNSKGGGMQPGGGTYRSGAVRVIDRNDVAALAEPGVLEAIAKGDGSVIVR